MRKFRKRPPMIETTPQGVGFTGFPGAPGAMSLCIHGLRIPGWPAGQWIPRGPVLEFMN
jgi:hypothetical protein